MPVRQGKGGPKPKSPELLKGHQPKRELDRAEPDRFVNDAAPPELDMGGSIAVDWFEALKCSPQARFFTAADWQRARLTAVLMSRLLAQEDPRSGLASVVSSNLDALLCSEDKRRQLRIEVRPEGAESGEDEAPEDVATVRALRGLSA